MQDFFIQIISLGSLLISIIILSFLISLLTRSHGIYAKFLKKHGFRLIFLVSSFATVGSLLLSMVWEFPPCNLCWYQRIFMYPIAFISLLAIYRKDHKNSCAYSLLLASVGFVIAGYHYLIQFSDLFKKSVGLCAPNSIDCSIPDFIQFGFVTTPFISLVVFLLIILSAIYASKKD